VREALTLYGRALSGAVDTSGPAGPLVRFEDGLSVPFPVGRYAGPPDLLDHELLDGVQGPVLDVGCGPGRHLRALRDRGVAAMGIDLSPVAVALARRGGARALVGDVFDAEVPGAGAWRTALLLDGNIGIGGEPVRLLRRLRAVLDLEGVVLVELAPPGSATRAARARIELAGERSGWFAWARVDADEIDSVAGAAMMTVEMDWACGERWFARLRFRA
jgi:SAM-dependent methyltransferase